MTKRLNRTEQLSTPQLFSAPGLLKHCLNPCLLNILKSPLILYTDTALVALLHGRQTQTFILLVGIRVHRRRYCRNLYAIIALVSTDRRLKANPATQRLCLNNSRKFFDIREY